MGQILARRSCNEVAANIDITDATILDASGKVVIPGFVDCHTHVVFGGSRVDEYVARLTGGDLDALRQRGLPVGIAGTVQATNALSIDGLVEQTLPRLRAMLEHGTTTVESKSGYALTTDGELRMLEANRRLAALQPIEIVSTFLGAHALPPDRPRDHYVDEVIQEMIPRVAEDNLAEFCDVFCEEGYFTLAETERILRAGLDHGLAPKLHLDQYSHSGAAPLAAALGCASVDHLNFTTPDELRLLADAGVVCVPLPVARLRRRPPALGRLQAPRRYRARAGLSPPTSAPAAGARRCPLSIAFAGRLAQLSPAAAIRRRHHRRRQGRRSRHPDRLPRTRQTGRPPHPRHSPPRRPHLPPRPQPGGDRDQTRRNRPYSRITDHPLPLRPPLDSERLALTGLPERRLVRDDRGGLAREPGADGPGSS